MVIAVKNQLIIFAVAVLISGCAGTAGQSSANDANGQKNTEATSPVKISGYIDAGGTVNSR
jgi:PBP1b-binding outer membrane lipoprotein LpoB